MKRVCNPKAERIDYSDSNRKIQRVGQTVTKEDKNRLDKEWEIKIRKILKLWELPIVNLIPGGYITTYINGTDLHGNKPFSNTESSSTSILTGVDKLKVLDIFNKAQEVGRTLGYTLGDITCGNMMFDGKKIYLIDYEAIVDYPLSEDYIRIWNNTLKIVFKD